MRSKNTIALGLLVFGIALILFIPKLGLAIVATFVATGALWEYLSLLNCKEKVLPILVGATVTGFFYFASAQLGAFVLCCSISFFVANSLRKENHDVSFHEVSVVIFGILYISWTIGHLVWLRALDGGRILVLTIVLLTVFRNIFAGMLGKYVRGRPISSANPKKNYSGALIGCSVTGVAGIPLLYLPGFPIGLIDYLCLTLIVGAAGQVGDLFESLIKRAAKGEDSGRAFGAQGGVFDTIDSFCLTAPLSYYYLIFFGNLP